MSETDGQYGLNDVSVVMGAYNEREAIGPVLDDIDDATDGQAEVVVVDSSTDGTAAVAREHGATVVEQPPQGYGVAVREALLSATNPVRITTDCDGTYPLDRIPDFLALINDGYDVVSGDRLYHGAHDADAQPVRQPRLRGPRESPDGRARPRRDHGNAGLPGRPDRGGPVDGEHRPLGGTPPSTGDAGYRVREEPIEYDERLGETKLDPFTGGAEIAKSVVKVCLEERDLL